MHVFVWESMCPPVWLSPLRAGQNGTGRRAPNWAQMAATDRDDGGINMLINNYLNNDTGYMEVGRDRDRKDRRGERDGGGGSKEIGRMRRGFEKAERLTDREDEGTRRDGK